MELGAGEAPVGAVVQTVFRAQRAQSDMELRAGEPLWGLWSRRFSGPQRAR